MNRFLRASAKWAGAVVASGMVLPVAVRAFPPAPHHTLFGMVRNELGQPLTLSSSEVILETPTGIELHCPVVAEDEPGVNYRLEVPMDSGISDDLYRPTALRPFFEFKLKVRIAGTIYLPIEMTGDFSRLGEPAGTTRLDLTLGVDSDGDGLPDAWERTMIAIYGGTLDDIRPGDDLDGDGVSNRDEYLAGTYASNPADGFSLAIVDQQEGQSILELLAVSGRTYSIQASDDLHTWTPVPFRLASEPSSALMQNYRATDVRRLRVAVPTPTGSSQLYFKALLQ